MGIARETIKLLMREGKREPFSGKALTAGRQDVYATEHDLLRWAIEMRFQLKAGIEMSMSDKKGFKERGFITDTALFQSLGFDYVDSMDYSDYEGCTIVHDLNNDVSDSMYDKYDFIFDGGTSEHIFNLPKVLENYHKMLKAGGKIIHVLPSTNYTDHGFYMFSPTLFHDYYTANKWKIVDSFFMRNSNPQPNKHLCSIYNYTPGCLDILSIGGLNNGIYTLFINVQKTDSSTFDALVQQGYYLRNWDRTSKTSSTGNLLKQRIKKQIEEHLPYWVGQELYFFYNKLYAKLPLRCHLKLIARY